MTANQNIAYFLIGFGLVILLTSAIAIHTGKESPENQLLITPEEQLSITDSTMDQLIQNYQQNPVLNQEMIRHRPHIVEYFSILEVEQFFDFFVGKPMEFTGEVHSIREDYFLERENDRLVKKPIYSVFISSSGDPTAYVACYVDIPSEGIVWPQSIRKDRIITVAGKFDNDKSSTVKFYPCRLVEREK